MLLRDNLRVQCLPGPRWCHWLVISPKYAASVGAAGHGHPWGLHVTSVSPHSSLSACLMS